MSKRDVIWVEGEKQLYMNMQRIMGANISAARESLAEAGMLIVNDAKNNLKQNHSIATGQLRASGRAQAVEGDPDAVDVGFFSDNTQGGYAAYVEYGTRTGGKRTIKFLLPFITQWMRKKGIGGVGMDFKSAAYFITRKIVRKGTQPHPFFTPAVEKNKKAVMDAIQEAIRKDIDGK